MLVRNGPFCLLPTHWGPLLTALRINLGPLLWNIPSTTTNLPMRCLLFALALSSATAFTASRRPALRSLLRMSASTETVIIGCGCPKRGMGWFHALQLLNEECPSTELTHIVEPWFLGAGADSPPGEFDLSRDASSRSFVRSLLRFRIVPRTFPLAGAEFAEFKDEWEAKKGVQFHTSVADLPATDKPRMALIAGRTADNPRLLREVIDGGCASVMLEKPGAPSVAELEGMAEYAKSKGVQVFMGFNKNIARYVQQARKAEAAAGAGASTKFVSLNAYKPDELAECFERNAEGMLKNMAIHELALAATFYGVTADSIAHVSVDAANSESLTLGEFTDFSKVDFTITTNAGKKVSIFADRCGGNGCEAVVRDADGNEVFKSTLPDAEIAAEMAANEAAHPDWMPYFFLQERDYRNLKEMCAAHVGAGKAGAPEGVATIEIAIEALRLAEALTPKLEKLLEQTAIEGVARDAIGQTIKQETKKVDKRQRA